MLINKTKHIFHVFSTFGVGGPQVRSCNIFNHFGDRFSHTILAMDNNYDAKTRLSDNLSAVFLNAVFHKQRTLRNIQQFRKILCRIRPDLLITYNWGAIEWAFVNSLYRVCPHIHLEEGFRPDEIHKQKPRRILLRRISLFRSHKIVVPSLTLKEIAVNIWKINHSKVEYIPNGIDFNAFSHNRSVHKSANEVIIGTVAGLRKEKNIPRLVRIFSCIPKNMPCSLWIAGNGLEYNNINNLITDLGLSSRIKMLGHIENPSDILKKMDIFAISSDTEQMPNSVLEAMASELPVVGTDVGDIRSMVSDINADYIVGKNEEKKFVDKLKMLIANPELRKKIGENNKMKCIKYYNNGVMYNNYMKLFELGLTSSQ